MGDKLRTLSSAIRLGATIHPQIYGNLFGWETVINTLEHTRTFRITGTCALGAAAVAIGKAPDSISAYQEADPYWDLQERFPMPHGAIRDCPEKECTICSPVTLIVTHLNDEHQWSREKIADWLEGLGF